MQLLEYQAKDLLRHARIAIPNHIVLHDPAEIIPSEVSLPIVIKCQVPVGGRGKLGGVKIVHAVDEFARTYTEMWQKEIKGHRSSALMLEEALDIDNEYYLSLRVNRDARRIEWLVSSQGGIDIEDNPSSVKVIPQDENNAYETISSSLDIALSDMKPLLQKLEKCFIDNDLLLLEINPLVRTKTSTLVCADAKVLVDDNALFRQPLMPTQTSSSVLPLGGTIGVIANGAGMAMSTMDTIYAAGGHPANFLDIGGGTGENVFVKNLRAIRDLPNVHSIIVNIFAGITHCDDIARGIIAAKKQLHDLPPLYIRLEGTNREEAVRLLKKTDIAIEKDLSTCVQKALRNSGSSVIRQSPLKPEPVSKSIEVDTQPLTPLATSSRPIRTLIFQNQPTIVQGITGHHGTFHAKGMIDAGTNIVAGVTPGKAGEVVHGKPVYNTVADAVSNHQATTSIVFVPARFAREAMCEALEAGITLIVCITEGIPVHDMLVVKTLADTKNATIIGPNCPGFVVPGSHKLGIIAASITTPGTTAIISRSGTLTYELAHALTQKGIGQIIVLGIGGDPIQGMNFTEALQLCQESAGIDRIVMIGEIGGTTEQHAADYAATHITKPLYGLIVGHSLPAGQQFGHAGAIVGSLGESAAEKTVYMSKRNVEMYTTLDELIKAL